MIDPDFWTDEKIVQLPFEARLLFIGLWNFADDEGLLWDEPDRIRLQVLPNDDVDAEDLLDLLVAAELLERNIDDDGRLYFRIVGFLKHQKIAHPTPSKIPRENSRKLAIPQSVRRAVALKYGCDPGETKDVSCYYCGLPGRIHWHRRKDGKPSAWVSFTLELDHFEAESAGGKGVADNIVLACRECNRSKRDSDGVSFFDVSRDFASPHGALTPNRREEKLREEKGIEPLAPAKPSREVRSRSIPASRPRNETWDALAALCGEPETASERGDFGKTVKELDEARASPDEIAAFGPWWWQHHPDAQLTHRCLRQHFGRFRNQPERPPQPSDIRNPMVRAALTTDLSDIRAEMEAKHDRRNQIPGPFGGPRELPADARGVGGGGNGPPADVLPAPRDARRA
ncbi:MAG TPA: HNH endonuclease signature motif containing protein [Thermomicrobiales bacterium]|nr:HNH endonuclease signature motif containing protein [Thermomicrobiales bacterium]